MRTLGVLVFVLVIGLSGCGGEEEPKEPSGPSEAELAEGRIVEGREACTEWIAPLQTELGEIESRLGVGMLFADYVTAVGDVRVAYDATDFEAVPDAFCLTEVAVPMENALNKYAEAATVWNECFTDYQCDFEADVLPGLQQQWVDAAAMKVTGTDALAAYQDPEAYTPATPPAA